MVCTEVCEVRILWLLCSLQPVLLVTWQLRCLSPLHRHQYRLQHGLELLQSDECMHTFADALSGVSHLHICGTIFMPNCVLVTPILADKQPKANISAPALT